MPLPGRRRRSWGSRSASQLRLLSFRGIVRLTPPALAPSAPWAATFSVIPASVTWTSHWPRIGISAKRFRAQFRAEFFNIFNHPNFANPFGGQNGWAHNDPSGGGNFFGCGCATPDVAAANPVIGSGGSRAVQLGLKLTF